MDKLSVLQAVEKKEEFAGRWFVVYVRNNTEFKVRDSLDCTAIVPMTQNIRYRKDKDGYTKRMVKVVPKYKNYVYVQHDGSSTFFQRVCANENVVSFPGSGRVPMPISDEDIKQVLKHEMPRTMLMVGDKVLIVDGQYKNLKGVIKEIHEDDVCTVEIRIFDIGVPDRIQKMYLIKQGD